jgi:hypothetical protein
MSDDLVKNDIQSRISGLAILKTKMDETFKAQQFKPWERIRDEYQKYRADTLNVFKMFNKSEQELDTLLTQAIEKLKAEKTQPTN